MVQRVLLQKAAGIGAADRQAGLDPVVRPEDVGFIDPRFRSASMETEVGRYSSVQKRMVSTPCALSIRRVSMVRCAVATMLLARMVRTLLGHSVCRCA